MQNNMHNMQKQKCQGSYSAYSAYCNIQYMLNMLNMSNNMLLYAKQYVKYAKTNMLKILKHRSARGTACQCLSLYGF